MVRPGKLTILDHCHGHTKARAYMLIMVEATTGWLEKYPLSHAIARNTILGLEGHILWCHGTPERMESMRLVSEITS